MAQYKLRLLPFVPALRSIVVNALVREGATLYQVGGDSSTASEVRDVWPGGTSGLTTVPHPLPETWTPPRVEGAPPYEHP